MLVSMTGFSSTTCSLTLQNGKTLSFTVELKTINTRFFEALCKLPSALSHLEIKIISLLQKKLIRGRVYLTVHVEGGRDALDAIAPAVNVAQGYVAAARALKEQLGLAGELSISDLVQLPDVFVAEKKVLQATDEEIILKTIDQVSDQLMQVRIEEGKTLEVDFEKIFTMCATKINEITEHAARLIQQKKDAVAQCEALSQGGDDVAKAQLIEHYAMLNKVDVHEEITRFNSHLSSIRAFFKTPQVEKGKRLDFVLQELLRETNTIMAKCSSYDISSVGVDIKVELEKAREQVQNII